MKLFLLVQLLSIAGNTVSAQQTELLTTGSIAESVSTQSLPASSPLIEYLCIGSTIEPTSSTFSTSSQTDQSTTAPTDTSSQNYATLSLEYYSKDLVDCNGTDYCLPNSNQCFCVPEILQPDANMYADAGLLLPCNCSLLDYDCVACECPGNLVVTGTCNSSTSEAVTESTVSLNSTMWVFCNTVKNTARITTQASDPLSSLNSLIQLVHTTIEMLVDFHFVSLRSFSVIAFSRKTSLNIRLNTKILL